MRFGKTVIELERLERVHFGLGQRIRGAPAAVIDG